MRGKSLCNEIINVKDELFVHSSSISSSSSLFIFIFSFSISYSFNLWKGLDKEFKLQGHDKHVGKVEF